MAKRNLRIPGGCIKREGIEEICDLPRSAPLSKGSQWYKRKQKMPKFFAVASPPHLDDVVLKMD